MKTWFPFTDYDFYAYVTSGVIVIAGVDYAFMGGVLVSRAEWTIAQAVFWTMMSYLIGHITAGLSSLVFEQWLVKKVLKPVEFILLGLQDPGILERLFKSLFAREYAPFPSQYSTPIVDKLCASMKCGQAELTDPEALFQTAFAVARYEATSESRLNQFMNLYGMCRNTAFAFLLGAAMLIWKINCNPALADRWLLAGTVFLSVGMFGRYLKFYAAYTRETLRAYGKATS